MTDHSSDARFDVPSRNPVAAWLRASGHLFNSLREANRATLAAFGFAEDGVVDGDDTVSYAKSDWSFERTVDAPGIITVGDSVRFTKTLGEADVAAFAEASGDTNRLHLDDDFAAETRFGRRIVHGTLVSGLISAALARLPGLTIYLSQDVEFVGPADIGDTLSAVVEVAEDLGERRYLLSTNVYDPDDELVIEGEAVVLIDSLPDEESGAE